MTLPPVGSPAPQDPDTARYVVCCEDCSLAYGSERWIEAIVTDEVWRKISPTGDEGGILCIACMSRRLRHLGMDKVAVILSGTEALRAATEDEVFQRGWRAAVRRIEELEGEVARLLASPGPRTPEPPHRARDNAAIVNRLTACEEIQARFAFIVLEKDHNELLATQEKARRRLFAAIDQWGSVESGRPLHKEER